MYSQFMMHGQKNSYHG